MWKYVVILTALLSSSAWAVYQPTESEMKIINEYLLGTEKNLKNALPLQSKAEICLSYIADYQRSNDGLRLVPAKSYWQSIYGYTKSSLAYSEKWLPIFYYYQKRLYEKYGPYPKNPQDIQKIIDMAQNDNYLNLNTYININRKYQENLRKKDLQSICTKGFSPNEVNAQIITSMAQATTGRDKLFYPGYEKNPGTFTFTEYPVIAGILSRIVRSFY